MERMEEMREKLYQSKITSNEYRQYLRDDTLRILREERNYQITEYLGAGSYGEVIAVNCPDYDDTVAVKIVSHDDAWTGELLFWPTLDHRNVLPLLEVVNLQYADLFITPLLYIDMETLIEDDGFINNPLALSLAKRWLREVLDALDYLYFKKLCHLDLKADNVLIDYDLRAVLCDFSFINNSDEQLERYGVPIPYRPPETCLACDQDIPVYAIEFEMWSYGILALNVLTGHYLKRRLQDDMKHWHKDIYPLIYEAMTISYFKTLMSEAFHATNIENQFTNAFNFVQFILRFNPEDRPSIEQTVNHIFLSKGKNMLEKPDDVWLFKDVSKWSCSCIRVGKPVKIHKDYYQSFKLRKSSKWSGIYYKKTRKWKKTPNYTRIEEDVNSSLREAEKCDITTREQKDPQVIFVPIQKTFQGRNHPNIADLISDINENNGVIKSSQPFGPTGDETGICQNNYDNQSQIQENNLADIEANNPWKEINKEVKSELPTEYELRTGIISIGNFKEMEDITSKIVIDLKISDDTVHLNEKRRQRKRGICAWFRDKFNSMYIRIIRFSDGKR